MINEELVNELIRHRNEVQNDFGWNTTLQTALDAAIAALKAEPCEDAIKRESVLNTLDTMDKALDENRTVEHYKELLKECYKTLPPVTPKQRTGKWVIGGYNDDFYVCDCGFAYVGLLQKYNYCPHCGARMDGDMYLEDE